MGHQEISKETCRVLRGFAGAAESLPAQQAHGGDPREEETAIFSSQIAVNDTGRSISHIQLRLFCSLTFDIITS